MNAQPSSFSPSHPLETPFRKAKQEWDLRLGTSTLQALNWRRAAFAVTGLLLVAIIGLIYLGAQPKVEPYLVQIDKIGAATAIGPIERITKGAVPPSPSVRFHLRRFLEDTRTISSDPAVLKGRLLDAYKLVTPAAANQLNSWIHDHNPLERGASERISIEIVGILPLSAETWQADWTETVWDEGGSMKSQTVWRATLRVRFTAPQTEEDIAANPIGLFVDEFHWAELHAKSPTAP
jgi:type IV secretory pathway TrbF-like protein